MKFADWGAIKAKYLNSTLSYRDLAKEVGVSFNTLKNHAVNEGWDAQRQQLRNEEATRTCDQIIEERSVINRRYFRIVNKLLGKAEGIIDKAECWQPTNLKEMTTAMKNLKDCLDVKSEQELREQAARIAKLEREAEAGTEHAPITVTFAGDANEFSK